jgi:hypothetical protein
MNKTKEDLSVEYANKNAYILTDDFTKIRKAYIAGWEARNAEIRWLEEIIVELTGKNRLIKNETEDV